MEKLAISLIALISVILMPGAFAQSIKPGLWRDTISLSIKTKGQEVIIDRSVEECMSEEEARDMLNEDAISKSLNEMKSDECKNIKYSKQNNGINYSATCKNFVSRATSKMSASIEVISPTEVTHKMIILLKKKTGKIVVMETTANSQWIGLCDPEDASGESKD